MKKLSESLIIEKKSKFYSYLYEVNTVDEVSLILNKLKEDNKKAKHICYAYKIGPFEKRTDDKEPSKSAGAPILDVIHFNNLDNVLIVVVRYFGGTLLGKGLLTRTYRKAATSLLSQK